MILPVSAIISTRFASLMVVNIVCSNLYLSLLTAAACVPHWVLLYVYAPANSLLSAFLVGPNCSCSSVCVAWSLFLLMTAGIGKMWWLLICFGLGCSSWTRCWCHRGWNGFCSFSAEWGWGYWRPPVPLRCRQSRFWCSRLGVFWSGPNWDLRLRSCCEWFRHARFYIYIVSRVSSLRIGDLLLVISSWSFPGCLLEPGYCVDNRLTWDIMSLAELGLLSASTSSPWRFSHWCWQILLECEEEVDELPSGVPSEDVHSFRFYLVLSIRGVASALLLLASIVSLLRYVVLQAAAILMCAWSLP